MKNSWERHPYIQSVCVCFCSCFHWAGLRLSFQSVTASLGLFHLLLLLSSLSSSSLHFLLKNLNITGRGAEACARLSVVDMVVRESVCESGSRSWWVGRERPVNSCLPVALLPFEFVASQNEPRATGKCPPGSWQAVRHQLQLFSLTDELNVNRKPWVMLSLLSFAKLFFRH